MITPAKDAAPQEEPAGQAHTLAVGGVGEGTPPAVPAPLDRAALLELAVSRIHDALHKGDIQAAHELAHRALGIDGQEIDSQGPSFFREFDEAFLTAVRKHNVAAAYVILDHDRKDPRKVRILSGGDVSTVGIIRLALNAGGHAIGERVW